MANAGLILAGTLIARLGLSALIERWVRTGSANPGPKILDAVLSRTLARAWGLGAESV